jgi:hypothetical protein
MKTKILENKIDLISIRLQSIMDIVIKSTEYIKLHNVTLELANHFEKFTISNEKIEEKIKNLANKTHENMSTNLQINQQVSNNKSKKISRYFSMTVLSGR